MKIYIAGPISGDPDYKAKFAAAAAWLGKDTGDRILNPAMLPEGLTPAQYMQICVPMLLAADRVVFLPGWENSKGAQIEHALAMYANIETKTMTPAELRGIIQPRDGLVQFQIPEPIDTSWIKRLNAQNLALTGGQRPGGLP